MGRKGGVTIEDVAAAVGVSRQTVSRVLNGSSSVRPAVRDRINSTIEALGYVPNLSARRMGGGRSFLILAINDRARTIENWQARRGNDWVDQMLYGGMTECKRKGYHLIFELVDTDPARATVELSTAIASLRPDGVILTPPHCDNASLTSLLADAGIPCARIGHREGDSQIDVYMDEESAARAATRLLLDLGHERIAFVAGAANYGSSALRVRGFESAVRDAGLPETARQIVNGEFHFDTALSVINDLLSQPQRPTAIIADNDEMSFAALHSASAHGLTVPDQLSIISFEDTAGTRFSVPPLTAVRQPIAEMVARCCELLIEAVAGGDTNGSHEVAYELILRPSTGPAEGAQPDSVGSSATDS